MAAAPLFYADGGPLRRARLRRRLVVGAIMAASVAAVVANRGLVAAAWLYVQFMLVLRACEQCAYPPSHVATEILGETAPPGGVVGANYTLDELRTMRLFFRNYEERLLRQLGDFVPDPPCSSGNIGRPATLFLHLCRTKAGVERLVFVGLYHGQAFITGIGSEDGRGVAAWLLHPSINWHGLQWEGPINIYYAPVRWYGKFDRRCGVLMTATIYTGQPNPADASKFSIRAVAREGDAEVFIDGELLDAATGGARLRMTIRD